jgi:hypothetical protein
MSQTLPSNPNKIVLDFVLKYPWKPPFPAVRAEAKSVSYRGNSTLQRSSVT